MPGASRRVRQGYLHGRTCTRRIVERSFQPRVPRSRLSAAVCRIAHKDGRPSAAVYTVPAAPSAPSACAAARYALAAPAHCASSDHRLGTAVTAPIMAYILMALATDLKRHLVMAYIVMALATDLGWHLVMAYIVMALATDLGRHLIKLRWRAGAAEQRFGLVHRLRRRLMRQAPQLTFQLLPHISSQNVTTNMLWMACGPLTR